jgi:hypothetical protein
MIDTNFERKQSVFIGGQGMRGHAWKQKGTRPWMRPSVVLVRRPCREEAQIVGIHSGGEKTFSTLTFLYGGM